MNNTEDTQPVIIKRLVLNMVPFTYDALQDLADKAGVSKGEIVRRAVGLYKYIEEARRIDSTTIVELVRGEKRAELVTPFWS